MLLWQTNHYELFSILWPIESIPSVILLTILAVLQIEAGFLAYLFVVHLFDMVFTDFCEPCFHLLNYDISLLVLK